MARGAFGQLIQMVPDLGLVVVLLSHVDLRRPDVGTADNGSWISLVNTFITPAID